MALFCSVLFATLLISLTLSQSNLVVTTEYGQVRGMILGDSGARVFRSIPYAAPPINDLRWVTPQPPQSWNDVLDCTTEVVGCPQSCHQLPLTSTECPKVQSEDCLYLNVWSPIGATSESSLPVLLWIHGGSFHSGYGGGLLYNGTDFVNLTNSVIVTINYRLGALGFLWDNQLGLEGNYGYLDQVYAIEWAQRNIKNFGGNADRIVIFGESAGAHSVALHLMNVTGIIAGGIMESPPIGLPLRTEASWGTLPLTFSSELGCDPKTLSPTQRLTCLRNTKSTDVVTVEYSSNDHDPQTNYPLCKGGMPWTPTVGNNSIIVDQPVFAFQKGLYNKNIPFMGGTNSGESFLFTSPVVPYPLLLSQLEKDLGRSNALKVLKFYNITAADNGENLMEQDGTIETDLMFRCATRNAMLSSVKYASNADNIGYMYHYNYIASYTKHVWYYQPLCWNHVCHTEELPVVWDPDASSIDVIPWANETIAAYQAQYAWINFAETGNPAKGRYANDLWIDWLNFESATTQRTLMINGVDPKNGIVMQNMPDKDTCDFWDSLNYNWINGVFD